MAAFRTSRIGVLVIAVLLGPWAAAAWATSVKIGLIDFALRHETLKTYDRVKVRSITFETSEYRAARFQPGTSVRGHGEVMAAQLIETFQEAVPGAELELYVASPFLEDAETGAQSIDFEQLDFAYTWFARQGVRIVAQTFVARNNPRLAAAVDAALGQGLVILTSAGNGPRQNAVPPFPASYQGAIGISTTALESELGLEERRNDYVRYSVPAPALSSLKLRQNPELSALVGSSRATVAAAALLGALSVRYRVETRDDATLLLDTLAVPVAQFGTRAAYGVGVLMQELIAQHLRGAAVHPDLRRLVRTDRAEA
jgi:hypothetical protein